MRVPVISNYLISACSKERKYFSLTEMFIQKKNNAIANYPTRRVDPGISVDVFILGGLLLIRYSSNPWQEPQLLSRKTIPLDVDVQLTQES
jgi:hypothetical protein